MSARGKSTPIVMPGAPVPRMPVPFWLSKAVKVLPDRVPATGAAGIADCWLS